MARSRTTRSDAILVRLEGKDGASEVLEKHLAYEQAVNVDSPLVLGNKLTLLQNGPATYQAMFAAIREAKDHINLETFIFDDDEVGREFSDLLLERQAAGVQVNVIHDSVGGITTPKAFFDRLRDGGIQVLEFNPLNPLTGNKKAWLVNNRDHRKQLVIDGRIAFTGGINISDTYSSAPASKRARKKRDQVARPDRRLARHARSDRRAGGRRIPETVHGYLGPAEGRAAGGKELLSRAEGSGRRDRARHRQHAGRPPEPDLSDADVSNQPCGTGSASHDRLFRA